MIALAILFLWNTLGNLVVPDFLAVPFAMAGFALLLLVARRAGATWDYLGLDFGTVGKGFRVGVVAVGAIMAAVAIAAIIPASRGLLADDRFVGVEGGEVLYETLIRIPFATALAEEVAFRGVLLGMLLLWLSPLRATIVASALFGLWHLLPGIEALETTTVAEPASGLVVTVAAVAGQVLVTALAGAGFAWLRFRGDSLAAPVLAHWALNVAAYVAGWLIVGNGWA